MNHSSTAVPSKEKLQHLYIEQGFSTNEIGALLKTRGTNVSRWMKQYGIEARTPGRNKSPFSPKPPTANELVYMVTNEKLTKTEIAQRYGVWISTVRRWFVKLGVKEVEPRLIKEKYSGPTPSRDELEYHYVVRGLNVVEVGEIYGVTPPTISNWLKKRDIKASTTGYFGREGVMCADGSEVRSSYERLVYNWLLENNIAFNYEPTLPGSTRKRADFYAHGFYVEVWGLEQKDWYRRRMNIKRALYRKHKAPLIELFPKDFPPYSEVSYREKLAPILNRLL